MISYTKTLAGVKSVHELCHLVEEAVGPLIGFINKDVTVNFATLEDDYSTGAFYAPYFNAIVVNRNPLRRLIETKPELVKDYLFYILLHEYIHSLGVFNEIKTRHLTAWVSYRLFGRQHNVTRLATGELNPFDNSHINDIIKNMRLFMMIIDEKSIRFFLIRPDFSDA